MEPFERPFPDILRLVAEFDLELFFELPEEARPRAAILVRDVL